MKNILRISAMILAFVAVTNMGQAQKFGYVNSQAILSELPEVKQAEANLEALQQQLQKRLQSSIETLQSDYLAIQQKVERGELSPVQQEEEGAKLQERQQALAQEEQNMVTQIQDKRTELLQPILDRVNNAINEVAKENNYTLIFDQAVLIYFEEEQNIEPMLRAKLNM